MFLGVSSCEKYMQQKQKDVKFFKEINLQCCSQKWDLYHNHTAKPSNTHTHTCLQTHDDCMSECFLAFCSSAKESYQKHVYPRSTKSVWGWRRNTWLYSSVISYSKCLVLPQLCLQFNENSTMTRNAQDIREMPFWNFIVHTEYIFFLLRNATLSLFHLKQQNHT